MSLFREVYAVPSRVRGAFRFLLYQEGNRSNREVMEVCLSPLSLRSEKGKKGEMVRAVINECIELGLFQEEGDEVLINPDLPGKLLDRDKGDEYLPEKLPALIFDSEENEDFCRFLAWLLCQDIYHSPGNWTQVEKALKEQVGPNKLGVNDTAYKMMEYWACYLGFSVIHGFDFSKNITYLVPDMTQYLHHALQELLLPQGRGELLRDFFCRFNQLCPVIEGGRYRQEIEKLVGIKREEWHMSTTTSHALIRLKEEGIINLWEEADADICVLDLGPERVRRYSNISLLTNIREGEA